MDAFVQLRRAVLDRAFSRMNAQQREAVFHVDGPLLILAGAGSGKTTVLINRIANLVQFGRAYNSDVVPPHTPEDLEELRACAEGRAEPSPWLLQLLAVDPCPAWRILAITFTNKAAGELKERLVSRLGEEGNDVTAGTFHSFCARILRRDAERLGFTQHFTIYDTDDSRRLMKEIMKSRGIEEKSLPHKTILAEISRAKDSLLSPEGYAATVSADPRRRRIAECYATYQARLKEANAMDFDDLLSQTVLLFQTCPDVLERYQKRYEYIMVDEYQDTNHAQYRLVSMLAERSRNLCVVGDDDQSIYQFRGATIENILSFEDEFEGCKTIRLEQNYRSTGRILSAANNVIAANKQRKGKTLWTANPDGEKIDVVTFDNGEEEAKWIASTILDKVAKGASLRDFAILYRANAQSNAIETALVRSGVSYRIFGGHRFYDTQEVRDAMAYLRVLCNPTDAVSLRRIINQPRRGIGDTTLERAAAIAEQQSLPLYKVLAHADEYPDISRAAAKLKGFIAMLDLLREKLEDPEILPHEIYVEMLEATGYKQMWELQGEAEAGRVENLKELESSLIAYERECEGGEPTLAGFLEEASLMTDVDNYDREADAVVMMTMHASKGLEFPTVFLPGMEDGIFPSLQTMFEPDKIEEERRLCYVAITRARERLYITNATSRMLYGQTNRNQPSRFLNTIPGEVLQLTRKTTTRAWGDGDFGGGRYGGSSYAGSRYGGSSVRPAYESSVMPDYESYSQEPPPAAARSSWAAAAATPKPAAPSAPACAWKAGDAVRHSAFGNGVIEDATPMGSDVLLTVAFDKVGRKKLMGKYAKLEKV